MIRIQIQKRMRPFVLNKTFVYKVNEGLSNKFDKDVKSIAFSDTVTDATKIKTGLLSQNASFGQAPDTTFVRSMDAIGKGVPAHKRHNRQASAFAGNRKKVLESHVRRNMASFEVEKTTKQKETRNEALLNKKTDETLFEQNFDLARVNILKTIRFKQNQERLLNSDVSNEIKPNESNEISMPSRFQVRPKSSQVHGRVKFTHHETEIIQRGRQENLKTSREINLSLQVDRFQFVNGVLQDTRRKSSNAETAVSVKHYKMLLNSGVLNSFDRTGTTTPGNQSAKTRVQSGVTSDMVKILPYKVPQFSQVRIETLYRKYKLPQDAEAYLVSIDRSPLFIWKDEKHGKIQKLIKMGEAKQAVNTLQKVFKSTEDNDEARNNLAVALILIGSYFEALNILSKLHKKFKSEAAICSNLMFLHICMGNYDKITAMQNEKVVRDIQAPLNDQTRSILAMIKFAQTSPQAIAEHIQSLNSENKEIKFDEVETARRRSSSNKKSGRQSAIRQGMTKETAFEARKLSKFVENSPKNQQLNTDSDQDSLSKHSQKDGFRDDTSSQGDVELGFEDFVIVPKIKKFHKRQSVVPVHHLLAQAVRVDKKLTPIKRSITDQVMTNMTQDYKIMLENYHFKDATVLTKKKQDFDLELAAVRKLCSDTEEFQRGVNTQIVKKERLLLNSRDVVNTDILRETVKREDGLVDGKKELTSLDKIFLKLISEQTVNVVGTDPLQESFEQLIEDIRLFNERFKIRDIIDSFLDELRDRSQSRKELIKKLQSKFKSIDQHVSRATEFILSLLYHATLEQALSIQTSLESMAHEAEDNKKREYLDTERYRQESEFTTVIEGLIHFAALAKRKQKLENLSKRRSSQQLTKQKPRERDQAFYQMMLDWMKGQLKQTDEMAIKRRKTSLEQDDTAPEYLNKNQQELRLFVRNQFAGEFEQFLKRMNEKGTLNLDQSLEEEALEIYTQLLIKCLNEKKELSGRSDDVLFMKTCGLTKQDLRQKEELEKIIQQEVMWDKIMPSMISKEKEDYYRKLVEEVQDRINRQELPKHVRDRIAAQIRQEVLQIEQDCADNYRQVQRMKQFKSAIDRQADPNRREFMPVSEIASKIEAQKRVQQRFGHIKTTVKLMNLSVNQMTKESRIHTAAEKLESQSTHFDPQYMQVGSKDVIVCSEGQRDLFQEHGEMKFVRKKMEDIQEIVNNQQILFQRDQEKQAPMMQRWGIPIERIIEERQKDFLAGNLALGMDYTFQKPKVGQEMSEQLIQFCSEMLSKFDSLTAQQKEKLDGVFLRNNKCFSAFEEIARMSMYRSLVIQRISGSDVTIEYDADDTQEIQIILKGRVKMMLYKHDLKKNLEIGQLVSGEVCGDESIQRKFMDVFKVLQKDRKFYQTLTEETVVAKIQRGDFIASIFQEMSEELFYKIVLLRQTPYFKDLSPYSLVTIASNVEVKEMKYGEVLIQQGDIPQALFILAFGNLKAVYICPETQTTEVSQFARKVLRKQPKPMKHGQVNSSPSPTAKKTVPIHETSQSTFQIDREEQHASKRAFGGTIMEESKKLKQVVYQDHVDLTQKYIDISKLVDKAKMAMKGEYHQVKQSDVVTEQSKKPEFIRINQTIGQRALLDNQIVKKYIAEHKSRLCQRLGIDRKRAEQELREKLLAQQHKQERQKALRAEAIKRQYKFCPKCFENGIEKCQCLLQQLSASQIELALAEEKEAQKTQTPIALNEESSLDFERLPSMEFNQRNELIVSETLQRVQTRFNATLKEIKRTKTPELKEPKSEEVEEMERLQKIEEMLVDKLHFTLTRSQASIVVASATAKFLVVKKEDKNFLNEYLKGCIDKAVLEEDFYDYDRPLPTFEDVQREVARKRGYNEWKLFYQDILLRESMMAKKINKLND